MKNALQLWINETCQFEDYAIHPMAMDASFRQYYRIHLPNTSWVLMDASADKTSIKPFIAISQALLKVGLSAPQVDKSDVTQGFLLLSDLGDGTLQKTVTEENLPSLYHRTLDSLVTLQSLTQVEGWHVPRFTSEVMFQELCLFNDWFFKIHLSFQLSPAEEEILFNFFQSLTEEIAMQPYVFMHRDFHSANLMVLPDHSIGILDFQDAFMGPITYDLVSLIKDCYHVLPENFVQELAYAFREKIQLKIPDATFFYWLDIMGLQRHLKALLTFSRKYRRDANTNYLQHIPRTINYILQVLSRHGKCELLHRLMQKAFSLCAV